MGQIGDAVCAISILFVLVTGKFGEKFTPTRGLRQGDPLSPYLFILCNEGLSSLLSRVKQSGDMRRVLAAKGGTKITHMLFVDDFVIFRRAKMEDWKKIQEMLSSMKKLLDKY